MLNILCLAEVNASGELRLAATAPLAVTPVIGDAGGSFRDERKFF
jgi:hypothetical protein